jgi:NADH-quinone oxidoreductase subunit H
MIEYLSEGNIWVGLGIRLMIVSAVILPLISVIAMFSIWWERKVAGHAQSRVGPMHVGLWHGWAQSLADGAKLLLKEDLIPIGADRFLFRLAPYLAFAPVFTAFVALPFGPQLCFESGLNIGVLYLLAVLSIEVMGTILAGWGSNSKWAIYGAMREACQMVSYEIPLGIAIIVGVITAGTLNLMELNYLQGNGIADWFVFHNPFIFGAFLIYFVSSLASSKRAPFDLPESESELVAGYHTEYSGLRFSFFFFAEYAGMFVIGAIQAVLFLGGWNSPLGGADPVYMLIGYDPVEAGRAFFAGSVAAGADSGWSGIAGALGLGPLGLIVLNAYCAFWIAAKVMTIIWIYMWLRWTLPRIRIDQVLYCCVKVLLPFSLVMLVGAAVWIWIVEQPEAILVGDQTVHRLGHLVSETGMLQLATQWVLTVLGVGFVLWFVVVMILGWLGVIFKDARQPRKSLFEDVMPVGREIAFTKGDTETKGE